ncbi:synaptonemal complex central element protein 3 [Hippocampus zosterae]|uniref:synaptonemal complex central element protein 3 n=1 Tax=Hippocampus zosterae TaxID=109293 RepID=UPI00223E0D92|nr:synaptonemal complex central element protein 3 [Hippocampus zosterae]
MADRTLLPGDQTGVENSLELDEHLERMIEDMENISVQLTWMAYDMSALRTDPELWDSMLLLEEACQETSNAVAGGGLQEPAPNDAPRTQM